MGDAQGGEDRVGRELLCHRRQGQMGGDQTDLEAGAGEHHHYLFYPAAISEKFRMSREVKAGSVNRFFVDRTSDHGVGTTC